MDLRTESQRPDCYGWHPNDTVEFLTPIQFEDGMDFDECENYYACLNEGKSRKALHLSRAAQVRRPSKLQLKAEDGSLPSCLRNGPNKSRKPRHQGIQRSLSFHTFPKPNDIFSHSFGMVMVEELHVPRVTFDDYVSVTTIATVEEYPIDVRRALWMSRQEMDLCVRSAMREAMLKRQQRQLREQKTEQNKTGVEPTLQLRSLLLDGAPAISRNSTLVLDKLNESSAGVGHTTSSLIGITLSQ